ncbi:hypothetical protein [Amycolatopsis orientalis]|uniref:hypothetical protein n=1 Tax=Amycolatopsis orientalis TaxID=31958 RepID=UPI00040EFCE3|nr:hypothetical protein [Amycolatopsis orientalis]
MIAKLSKLGERLLGKVVPVVEAQAGGAGAQGQIFCYCLNHQARYRSCPGCGCHLLLDC